MKPNREQRMLSRRAFLTATAAGIGSLALASCGSSPATTTTGSTTVAGSAETAAAGEAAAPPTPSPAPTLTPAVLGTGSQKITFWHGLGGADGATMVQMLQTYAGRTSGCDD